MSSLQHFLDSKRSGKAPEKSNFVSTCNLLSQYLKEKGNLKNLSREITGQLAAIAKSSETSRVTIATSKKSVNTIEDLNLPPTEETMSMDTLPQFTSMASSINSEDTTNKASTSKEAMEPKGAQMTIFYDGKIWVFNGLAADKAQEVALLAGKGSSHSGISNLSSTSGTDKISPAAAGASISAAPLNPVSNSGKLKEHVQPLPDANDSVIPIARRSSLHRFLGKRKERAIAREPYQVQDAPASSSKNDEQLELKL